MTFWVKKGREYEKIVKCKRRVVNEIYYRKEKSQRNLNSHNIGITEGLVEIMYMNESFSQGGKSEFKVMRELKKENIPSLCG